MDSEHLAQLLQRYWQCETTPEEERLLRQYFASHDVPPSLKRCKDWFGYIDRQETDVHLDSDFDRRLMQRLGQYVVKARRRTLRARLAPLWRGAAAVAVLALLGGVVQHSLNDGTPEVAVTDTVGQQIAAPSVALSAPEKKATHARQVLDTLQQACPESVQQE